MAGDSHYDVWFMYDNWTLGALSDVPAVGRASVYQPRQGMVEPVRDDVFKP